MKKVVLALLIMLLMGCVPPAEELAGVTEEPVEEVEIVEEKVVEEVQEPVEEVKEPVKNETSNTTTQPAQNTTTQQSQAPSQKEYFTGDPISIGEGETKIIVIDQP